MTSGKQPDDGIKRTKGKFDPLTETATQIPLSAIMPIFAAISDRNWVKFKELELEFANNHGVETWADVFNFRVKPALDKDSDRWLLIQWCSKGYTVKIVA